MARRCLRRIIVCLSVIALASTLIQPTVAQDDEKDDLFFFPPRTPERLIRAAIIANQLDRPILARKYLATFLENRPGNDTLLSLKKTIGIHSFLDLSSTLRLHPESPKVLAAINAANPHSQLSSSVIVELVESLGSSSDVTTEASLKLLSAEADAVEALLDADPKTESGKIADLLLKRYSRRFESGLIAALSNPSSESNRKVRILNYLATTASNLPALHVLPLQYDSSPAIAAAAKNCLAKLDSRELVGLTETAAAQVLVVASMKSMQSAESKLAPAVIGMELETVDDENSAKQTPPEDLESSIRLATAAVQLDDSSTNQSVLYAAEAASSGWPARWPEPVSGSTADDSAEDSETVHGMASAALSVALDAGSTTAVLQILRHQDLAYKVLNDSPENRRQILNHKDCRVRLLAAGALVKADASSERAIEIIESAAKASKKAQAVVIDPRTAHGSVTADALRDLGYEVKATHSGRAGFSAAVEQMSCELVLIHTQCQQWPLSVTIANLRTDYRTHDVPIVIYGPAEHRSRVDFQVRSDNLVWFESQPLSAELSRESFRLQGVRGPQLTGAERMAMKRFAMQHQKMR